ncbi:MAG: hypothetical protein QW767_02730 [Thermoprotei archaeon]
MVAQFRINCKKCNRYSDVTKYVVTPTYTFLALTCGHRLFLDTARLGGELQSLGVKEPLIAEEIRRNLERPRNYPTGEGKHE